MRGQPTGEHGADKPDLQTAGHALGDVACQPCRLRGLLQQSPRPRHQRLARLRQLHRLAVSGEQAGPHGGFELLDVGGQWGLRNRQALGGPAEMQFFRQRQESSAGGGIP
jgi:hypothetical protein